MRGLCGTAVTDPTCSGEDWRRVWEVCAGKAMGCSVPGELFCRSLEDEILRAVHKMEARLVTFQREG